MSISEIESIVDQLPLAEQEELLRHLQASLRNHRSLGGPASREEWMHRLHALRDSIGTGATSLSGESILADLREE
jgi:hypothetical protein